MDEAAALSRMRHLLRPGGSLAVIGLARPRLPADLPVTLAGTALTRLLKANRTYWETPAPKVWPPPHTFGHRCGAWSSGPFREPATGATCCGATR